MPRLTAPSVSDWDLGSREHGGCSSLSPSDEREGWVASYLDTCLYKDGGNHSSISFIAKLSLLAMGEGGLLNPALFLNLFLPHLYAWAECNALVRIGISR